MSIGHHGELWISNSFKELDYMWKGWVSLVAQTLKDLPAIQETWVLSLGQENPLEKETATHSCILACIPVFLYLLVFRLYSYMPVSPVFLYSCLTDCGDLHGVTKSQTQLSD